MDMLTQKQKIIVGIIAGIVVIVIGYYYINSTKEVYNKTVVDDMVEEDTDDEEIEEEEEAVETIIVHIAGAVKSSGVVEVKEDARINDVIEAAGGLLAEADLSNVNLAYVVEDGQKIYIPSIYDEETEDEEETQIVSSGAGNVSGEEKSSSLININTASSSELTSIPGVGDATATKIIEYRTSNGKFQSIEEIKNVSGIGDAKFEAMKDYITV